LVDRTDREGMRGGTGKREGIEGLEEYRGWRGK
jgi:hypothetical protein